MSNDISSYISSYVDADGISHALETIWVVEDMITGRGHVNIERVCDRFVLEVVDPLTDVAPVNCLACIARAR